MILGVALSVGLLGCGQGGSSSGTASACDPNDGGLTLPDGFCATVVAENLGSTRHITVAENGDVYAAVRDTTDSAGIVALRDTDGDYKADRTEYFGDGSGTGIGLRNGYLYFGANTAIWRYKRASNELVPSGNREMIVDGFPEQGQHAVKPFAFDGNGHLYVNVGAPSNACMEQTRTKGSPGQDPCPLLKEHAGIWRYQADETGQQHTPDARYASGIRNAVALTWNDAVDNLYAVQHGRDQLHQFFPDLYTQKESAELPRRSSSRSTKATTLGGRTATTTGGRTRKSWPPSTAATGKKWGAARSSRIRFRPFRATGPRTRSSSTTERSSRSGIRAGRSSPGTAPGTGRRSRRRDTR
ncbi:MAG: sorbosone dehydrogenase family protein [Salinibacter sp.]